MDVTKHLLSSNSSTLADGWKLLRCSTHQALPCRVPFELSGDTNSLAVQAYAMQLLADARRFIELRRLSCKWDDEKLWSLRLLESILLVEQGQAEEGWHELQLALSWRNRREQESVMLDALPAIGISEWLVMSTIALANEKTDTAESYASEAVAQIEQNANCSVGDLLQDTRGDAMTVFAAVRLAQHRYHEAETLLDLAYDAHVQSGDLEQMAVDLILLSDVEVHGGDRNAATFMLFEVERILTDECDPTRHLRCASLKQVVHSRMQEMKEIKRFAKTKQQSMN